MKLRHRARAAVVGVSLAGGGMCGWAGAPFWLVAAMLAAGIFVALRPFGKVATDDEVEALQDRLSDARRSVEASLAGPDVVPSVVTPVCLTLPRSVVTRVGRLPLEQRSMLLRDEITASRWHALTTLLRMQPARVETRGNFLARFIDFALAKPKQL